MQTDIDLTKRGEAYVAAALAQADGVFFITVDGKDRASIATSIEKLINMLDELDPDTDDEIDDSDDEPEPNEPSLGWTENCQGMAFAEDLELDDADKERTLGWELGSGPYNQSNLAQWGIDEVEEENEHGGDIQDEPHDREDEDTGIGDKDALDLQREAMAGGTRFNGDGYVAGVKVLRNLRRKRPDVPQEHVAMAVCYGNPDALHVDGLTIVGKDKAVPQSPSLANVRPMLSEDPWPRPSGPRLSADDFRRLPWA